MPYLKSPFDSIPPLVQFLFIYSFELKETLQELAGRSISKWYEGKSESMKKFLGVYIKFVPHFNVMFIVFVR